MGDLQKDFLLEGVVGHVMDMLTHGILGGPELQFYEGASPRRPAKAGIYLGMLSKTTLQGKASEFAGAFLLEFRGFALPIDHNTQS